MKNKYFKTALCLGVGVITLTAAVFANYDNANGYSVCKNAAKSMLYETNYTMHTKLDIKIDGESLSKYDAVYQTAGGQNPMRYISNTYYERSTPSDDFKTSKYESYRQDNCDISINTDSNGMQSSYVYEMYNSDDTQSYDSDDGSLIGNRSEMTEKVINFAELACDALVGDLKNSIILVDSKDDKNTYNISLSENQMPELISSGISLLIGSTKQSLAESARLYAEHPEDYGDVDDKIFINDTMLYGGDPTVDSVNGTVTVLNNGKPESLDGSLYISGIGKDGKHHVLEVSVSLNFSNYGTTSIEKRDINSLPSAVIYDGDGAITIIKDSDSTAEMQTKAQSNFNMYSEGGYSHVYLKDQNGNIIAESSGRDDSDDQ